MKKRLEDLKNFANLVSIQGTNQLWYDPTEILKHVHRNKMEPTESYMKAMNGI